MLFRSLKTPRQSEKLTPRLLKSSLGQDGVIVKKRSEETGPLKRTEDEGDDAEHDADKKGTALGALFKQVRKITNRIK